MTIAGFSRFPPEALDFLSALKANNDRDWFARNKSVYQRAFKAPAELFCRAIGPELEALTGLPHEAKIYRIHRDVRFSRDKTPYNAHLHISFMPRTSGPLRPGWYFGLEPARLVVGTGVFETSGAALDALRERLAGSDGARLSELMRQLALEGIGFNEPELKRVPQPYPGDHPRADLLRRKSLIAWHERSDPRDACREGFAGRCMTAYARLRPLFDWLAAAPAEK